MAKNVNIRIQAEDKASSKIKQITEEVNKIGNNSTVKSFGNLTKATVGAVGAFALALKGVKALVKGMKELNEINLVQVKAEKQLESAAKNNPYLNKSSVQSLKSFASELQKIGTYGDEQLLPLMAQLASSGRTQTEIQDIMATALDVSASGAMSLESAVRNLNKTYGGTSGELGEVIPAIKNLTSQQLKNGDAVKLVAQQYKGLSKEVTSATGTGQQLQNAWGDLKESIGAGFTAMFSPAQRFFTWVIDGINKVVSGFNNLIGVANTGTTGDISVEDTLNTQLEKLQKERNVKYEQYIKEKELLDERLAEAEDKINNGSSEKAKEDKEKSLERQNARLQQLKERLEKANSNGDQKRIEKAQKALNGYQEKISKKEEETAKKNAERLQKAKEEITAKYQPNITTFETDYTNLDNQIAEIQKKLGTIQNDKANALSPEQQKEKEEIEKVTNALNAQIEKIKAKYDLEEQHTGQRDKVAEQQEIISAKENTYLELVTSNNQYAKESAEQLNNELVDEWATLENLCGSAEKYQEVLKKYAQTTTKSRVDELKEDLAILEEQKIKMEEVGATGTEEFQKIKDAISSINDEIDNLNFEGIINKIDTVVTSLNGSFQSLGSSVNSALDTYLSAQETESDEQSDKLKEQYEDGLISYEDYLSKKDDLDKESAEREYKIKLAQYYIDLSMAIANGASAVLSAMKGSSSAVDMAINMATATMLTGAQIATIAGNKPVAPKFSTGGFLTGSSTSGDKIPFMGNAGEAILNPAEQRNFMDMANGNYNGGITLSMPISIENNVSEAQVSAEQNERMIKITVDKIVNSGLKAGTYNDGLQTAETNKKGVRYL